jgi:hypothetical protein
LLEYDEDEGIIWITPMLASEVIKTKEKIDDIICTIDDCDCHECGIRRGWVGIDRNIMLKIPLPGKQSVVQRLTIEEARLLGCALVAYAENLNNIMGEEDDGDSPLSGQE